MAATASRKPARVPRDKRVTKRGMINDFVRTFGIKLDLDLNTMALNEELVEFEAALENLLKEAIDVLYTAFVVDLCKPPKGQKAKVDKETVALIKRSMQISEGLFGRLVLDEAFARVHASNMSKIGPKGEIAYKPWGGIAKGPFYQPAVLHDLVT